MQRAVERTTGHRFDIVSDRKPKWLADLESAGRRAIHTPKARRAWQEAVREAEIYIDRLRDTGTRQQTLAMLKRMQEAVDQGREALLEEAIRWRIYDKQLYNLKRIARTEISTAYHRATIAATKEDDLIIGYRWRLSASHPDPDICDWFAGIELGLGKGVWPKDRVPEEKAHPHCLCHLTPVTRTNRTRGAKHPGELMAKLRPEDKVRMAPRWARDLNGLGIDWDRMVDPATGWFARKKDVAAKVGEDRLQAMQAIGRSLGERDWGGIRPRGGYRLRLMELAKQHSGDPAARRIRRALERDEPPSSLDVHYLKRRYVDGIDLDSPVDLDHRHDAVLQSSDALVYRQTMGESVRWVVRDLGGSWVAIVGMDGRRITAYPLEGEIPQTWEQKWPMSELKSL